ncbi:MAG: LacI family DNA-binding transcriptional regulator [Flavobacteriaceae bacterium]|nr:LacI family DNA-binding transcriptional regulator [Flavobacteriaceae bacterium]
MKYVTIKDVAKKLNVSISSVSRAFNDKYDIKKETKELILITAKEMGYHPNPIAQKLSQKKSFNIGVIVPEFINEYYSEIIIGIQKVLIENGYQVLVMQSDESPNQELANVMTLTQNMVDGLIIAPTLEGENMEFYLELCQKGHAIVFMGRIDESLPASKVIFNNFKWSFFATEHLISQGYTKIHHLSGYYKSNVSKERIKGFRKALEKHKIPKENFRVIETGFFAKEGIKVIDDLINSNDLPEAFFCENDLVALGVIKKLRDSGIKVPDDIAVIGFTETIMAKLMCPQLSSVKQPTYEMGENSAKLLLKILKDENSQPETIIFDGELNIRESSINKRK